MRGQHRDRVDPRDTRWAHGPGAGNAPRSPEARARLLLRPRAHRGGPSRSRRTHPDRAVRHRGRAEGGTLGDAARDHSAPDLRRRVDGGIRHQSCSASTSGGRVSSSFASLCKRVLAISFTPYARTDILRQSPRLLFAHRVDLLTDFPAGAGAAREFQANEREVTNETYDTGRS